MSTAYRSIIAHECDRLAVGAELGPLLAAGLVGQSNRRASVERRVVEVLGVLEQEALGGRDPCRMTSGRRSIGPSRRRSRECERGSWRAPSRRRTAGSGRSRRALSSAGRRGLAASARRRATRGDRRSRHRLRRPRQPPPWSNVIGRTGPRSSARGSAGADGDRCRLEAAGRPGNRLLLSSPSSKKFQVASPSSEPGSSRETARLPSGWAVRTISVPAATMRDSRRGVTVSSTV